MLLFIPPLPWLRTTTSGVVSSRWRHVFSGWLPIPTKYKTLTRQKKNRIWNRNSYTLLSWDSFFISNFYVPLLFTLWLLSFNLLVKNLRTHSPPFSSPGSTSFSFLILLHLQNRIRVHNIHNLKTSAFFKSSPSFEDRVLSVIAFPSLFIQ